MSFCSSIINGVTSKIPDLILACAKDSYGSDGQHPLENAVSGHEDKFFRKGVQFYNQSLFWAICPQGLGLFHLLIQMQPKTHKWHRTAILHTAHSCAGVLDHIKEIETSHLIIQPEKCIPEQKKKKLLRLKVCSEIAKAQLHKQIFH